MLSVLGPVEIPPDKQLDQTMLKQAARTMSEEATVDILEGSEMMLRTCCDLICSAGWLRCGYTLLSDNRAGIRNCSNSERHQHSETDKLHNV